MSLQKPPLYEMHKASGADFTDFGGWEMPVEFDGIRHEHEAVRDSVGIFDVSHMSEVVVTGADATALMNRLTTNDVRDLDPGSAQYSCILDKDGVILDDTVVYRYPDNEGYLFVPNAGHGQQMCRRWSAHAEQGGLDVTVEDQTKETGLVAVQGPSASKTVDKFTSDPLESVGKFECLYTEIEDTSCLVARTGYTGEDGFEIFFDVEQTAALWEVFDSVQPCGLGSRDTLRLEAGLLLSGQDFDSDAEPRTPLEAGLNFVVDFSKPEFVGKEALEEQQRDGVDEMLVGIKVEDRAIARPGYTLVNDDEKIGHITSGTQSPTFNTPLALGYIDEKFANVGTKIGVQVRDRTVDATVVNHRFLTSLDEN